jgi:hypothetical protein
MDERYVTEPTSSTVSGVTPLSVQSHMSTDGDEELDTDALAEGEVGDA